MKIQPPQLPAQPQAAEDFLPLARRSIGEERPIEEILLRDCAAEGESMPKLEVRRCILEGCTFSGCDLSGAGFADVAFTDCNFSNCRLSDAYFSRCRFFGCKWLGAELDGAVLRQITMENSNLRYASFDKAKLQDLLLHNCDFTEASFSEVRWKNLSADGCRFLRTNFFKTPLSGMDFTQNELLAPILSSPPTELRGAKISLLQAADLIELFGVKVDR